MRNAKRVPEHNIGILDRCVAICDPFGQPRAGLARCLRYVASGGVELIVRVRCDVHGVTGKPGAFPHERTFFREQLGNLATDELVGNGFVGVGVEFVGVGHFPCARGDAVVVADGFVDGFVFGFVRVEGVSVGVFGRADGACALHGVGLEDGVVGAVDVGVNAQTEEMLMIVCVDAGVDFGTPALGVFAGVHGIGV